MKKFLFYVYWMLIAYLFFIGLVHLFMLTNVFIGLLSIFTSVLMVVVIRLATDERETFGR